MLASLLSRRTLLSWGSCAGAAWLLPTGCERAADDEGLWVNDVHSGLNRTRVRQIEKPETPESVREILREANRSGRAVSIAGGRHAMGGQQFGRDTILIDGTGLDEVLDFNPRIGHVELGSGMKWPEVIGHLQTLQGDTDRPWSIVQKQTGADQLCLGGAVSANAHGRGLTLQPMIQDVESVTLVDAGGDLKRCSRTENEELFRLVVGGYGLFGVLISVQLRLMPRRKLERVVEIVDTRELMDRFEARITAGFLFGDCQFSTDLESSDGLRRGVFSCYRPVHDDTPMSEDRRRLSPYDWEELLVLAHSDRGEAFRRYSDYYLNTSGQIYWSDTHQLSTYLDGYHSEIVTRLGPEAGGGEMITEIYVPRESLYDFLELVREQLGAMNLIYGTIRLIEKDDETFLPWARESFACVIFNLHVGPGERERSEAHFRALIDLGLRHGGGYFLTYHRWATREQVLACYPQFPEFLRLKRKYDPEERFQSDWYRHYRQMFEDLI